jgi:hypothetical protein
VTSVRQISNRPCSVCAMDTRHHGLKCQECGLDTVPSVSVWETKARARSQSIAGRNGAKKGGRAKAANLSFGRKHENS